MGNLIKEWRIQRHKTMDYRHRTKTKHTEHRILKGLSTQTPPNTWGLIQVLAKSKEFLIRIKHSSCYSKSDTVKVLLVIEEINHL